MTGGDVPPRARRARRPRWRDPRVGVGVLLVVGSVALGVWVVGGASRGEQYYVAAQTLTPGDVLDEAAVRAVDVRLGATSDAYLLVADGLPAQGVVTRVVVAGELVPAAAVGSAGEVDSRPVGVPVTGPLPSAVVPGATVDLWLTVPGEEALGGASAPARPERVAAGLVVADVVRDGAVLGAVASTSVEVLVPDAELPAVLAALASEGTVTLVPAPAA